MTTRLLPAGALLDELATAIQRYGRPQFALFTTYTFDANLFASQFLPSDLSHGSGTEDNFLLRALKTYRQLNIGRSFE